MDPSEEDEWWKPDKFEVIDYSSNSSLGRVRERLIASNQLRAQYAKSRSRCGTTGQIAIPLVVRPLDKDNVDGGDVLMIGDVVTWPAGTAEKILSGELRVATATFQSQKKRQREKAPKTSRFRRHSLMQISIQQAEHQGERPLMEDRYIIHLFNDIAVFGVFDGHAGTAAADFVADTIVPTLRGEFQRAMAQGRNLSFTESNPQPPDAIEVETVSLLKKSLQDAIIEVESRAIDYLVKTKNFSGSTLCICLCTRSTLLVASLGDSRVYVSRNGIPKQVTKKDHVARDNPEKDRIIREGGFVTQEGYLGGLVQVSRAIGDVDPSTNKKIVGLSAEPEIIEFPFDKERDEFVILACDGLWEVISGQYAVSHVRSILKETSGDLLRAAEGLVALALEKKTSDNVTVVLAFLPGADRIWTKSAQVDLPDEDNRPRLFRKSQNKQVDSPSSC